MGVGLDYLQIGAVPARSQRLRVRLHVSRRCRRTLPVHHFAVEPTFEFQVLSPHHRTDLARIGHHNTAVANRIPSGLRLRRSRIPTISSSSSTPSKSIMKAIL